MDRIAEIQRAIGDSVVVSRLLGTGGFAEVYEATDTRLGRTVALKVLRADVAAPRARDRFIREARAAAQIRHPNVLAVFDVGQQGEIVWFTMPLVTGESLRERLDREKRLDSEEALRILADAASGLHAAHRARLVHRDVKPDNILLDGPERHVLLADFGVAAAAMEESDRITTEGAVVGTPRYMSPEQASGESVVDARADVYALGVVGYEMIAGEPPFTAPNAGALLAKHLTAPVPPLRARVADCSSTLANAIERALEKDPADRWPSADAMRQALEGRVSSRISEGMVAMPVAPTRAASPVAITLTIVALTVAIATDAMRGAVIFSPIVALAAVLVWALAFAAARVAREQAPAGEKGRSSARRVRRARALRMASRALLASMPKSERARLGPVDLVLDQLLFSVEHLAGATTTSDDLDRAVLALSELQKAIESAGTDPAALQTIAGLVARYESRPGVPAPTPS